MQLIIAEKAIAGRRIADILSNGTAKEQRDGALFFSFDSEGKKFMIVPLRGHIMDVDFPKHLAPWIGTDLVKLTNAEILYNGKEKQIISFIKKHSKDFDRVIFATDSDREGESIALEALTCLREKNPKIKIKRANFSAITKEEINTAFKELNEFDFNFADSADARREIDLVWGAVLTRFLSIVSGRLGKEFISAGRVQSPTLALVVAREREIRAFKPKNYWRIEAKFEKEKKKFNASHKKGRFWEKEEAEKAFAKKAEHGEVKKVSRREKTLARPEPFNTTSFLRAATAIGFSAAKAMSLAETLYQQGLLSYPRTDNTVFPVSINLRKILKQLSHVSEFNADVKELLARKKLIPSKGKKPTKDHPPIHPVDYPKRKLSDQEWKIYELVCRRFFAVLSDNAKVEAMTVNIDLATEPYIATGQRFIEWGWKKVYPYSKSKEVILPELKEGDLVKLLNLELLAKETKPPARYSQGSLIKAMSEKNLGTKSTRHETIQKLYYRNFIQGAKAIEATNIAFAVIDTMEKFDAVIVKPEMTAELEKEMDEIAAGKKKKNDVVLDSRKMLVNALNDLLGSKVEVGKTLRSALREDSEQFPCTGENCEGTLVTRKGYSGKRFLGCSAYPKCTVTYPLPQKGKITPGTEPCAECGKPMIKVKTFRYSYSMCIDPNCKTKEAWRKKNEERKAAAAKK